MIQCLAPNMRPYLLFGYQYLILGHSRHARLCIIFLQRAFFTFDMFSFQKHFLTFGSDVAWRKVKELGVRRQRVVLQELWEADKWVFLRASKYFSVSKGTLDKYVKDTFRSSDELANVHLGRTLVLPNGLENELVQYCLSMEQRHCALGR